jgi:sec-independent protein translocase protein TatA
MELTIFSAGHVLIIILVMVLLFGGKKIPELMKGIGEGIKEFKKATKDDSNEDTKSKGNEKIIEKV